MINFQKLLALWWVRIALFFVLLIICAYAFNKFAGLINIPEIRNINPLLAALVPSIIIQNMRKGAKWHSFGLGVDKYVWKDFGISFLFLVILLAVFYIIAVWGSNKLVFHSDALQGKIIYYFTFFVGSVAFEELIFRGIAFQALLSKCGDYTASVIMSIIFTAAHLLNPNMSFLSILNIFLAGLLLSIMYIQTKSLWLPFFFHLFWNVSINILIGSKVSGWSEFKPYIEIYDIEKLNSVMYGGNFGVEAGIITTFLLVIFIYLTLVLTKESPYKSSIFFKIRNEESKLLYK